MQERRTTVRVPYQARAQYCAAEDLLPRDGRLTNVSERGAGLQIREARKPGEQVTISFSLPQSADALTATGLVRWASSSGKGKWHAAGLEWLPLEEASRNRLHSFLTAQPASVTPPAPPKTGASGQRARFSWLPWAAALVLVAAVMFAWVQSVDRRATRLELGVAQRNTVITVLKDREQRMAQRESWLRQELVTAKTHLATASSEMARMDQQADLIGSDAQRLRQEVDLFQRSYDTAQKQRADLIQEVMNLEQERLRLVGKLSSLPELQRAIRETIEARKQEQHAEWLSRIRFSVPIDADNQIRPEDNRGFVIRDGQSTQQHRGAGMAIRVLEPESGR